MRFSYRTQGLSGKAKNRFFFVNGNVFLTHAPPSLTFHRKMFLKTKSKGLMRDVF